MTDPKKRLKEILKTLCYNTMGNPPYRIDQAITKILKDFVHKDTLDKVADSCMYDFPKSYTNSQINAFQKGIDKMRSALLKILEGKK